MRFARPWQSATWKKRRWRNVGAPFLTPSLSLPHYSGMCQFAFCHMSKTRSVTCPKRVLPQVQNAFWHEPIRVLSHVQNAFWHVPIRVCHMSKTCSGMCQFASWHTSKTYPGTCPTRVLTHAQNVFWHVAKTRSGMRAKTCSVVEPLWHEPIPVLA